MNYPSLSRKPLPKAIRDAAKAKCPGRCGYCGQETDKIQIDHIKSVYYGGTDDIENLMPSCFTCNNYKNILTLETFRDELHKQVERARKNNVNFRLAEKFGLVTAVDKKIVFYFETLITDKVNRQSCR